MLFVKKIKHRTFQMGLGLCTSTWSAGTGTHWLPDPFGKVRVDIVSRRDRWSQGV